MRSRPHFYWQGALIILPALILAGAGFYSLRQDRVLAEHEAGEQARRLATAIAHSWIPQALQLDLPAAGTIERFQASPGSAEDDPIYRFSRATPSACAFLVNAEGGLAYPPPVGGSPVPQPVVSDGLNAAQISAWQALRAENSAGPLEHFLATAPPERLIAIATYRTALSALKKGERARATNLFQRVLSEFPEAASESGYPLADFAALQLASLQGDAQRDRLLDALGWRVVLRPTPLTDALLQRAANLSVTARNWRSAFLAHDRARSVFAVQNQQATNGQFHFEGQSWFLVSQPASNGSWVRAIPKSDLSNLIRQAFEAHAVPADFLATVTVGATSLWQDIHPSAEPLAVSSGTLPTIGAADIPVTVRMFLSSPERFFAAQRARTLRFGALIGFAAVSVLIGFGAAWRAFHKQQRLSEMKTNFVSSVSHELRAPIASVRLLAEELEQGASPKPEKLRQYHRFIVQECRRLSAVIENVLDFARREQGRERFEFEEIDLARLVEETAASMRFSAAERDVTIRTIHLGAAEPMEADGQALQRLLVNLLDNAMKHSPPSGVVTAGLEFGQACAWLSVEDDGPGIPRQEQDRIFERFYRIGSELRRETEGVGLGLAIVKHIAEVHGGRVLVRSDLGKGSRFTVELPLRKKESSGASPEEVLANETATP